MGNTCFEVILKLYVLILYMYNIKRIALFLIGCLGTRFAIIFIQNKYFNIIKMLIGIGFLTIYLTDSRKYGLETFGDPIWWNDVRPIHGILYLISGITASNIPLIIDLIFSILFYIYHMYNIYG